MSTFFTARYGYVRVSFKYVDIEVVVGIEYRPTSIERAGLAPVPSPGVSAFYRTVRDCLETTVESLMVQRAPDDMIAYEAERAIRENMLLWEPGQSYFVEVGRGAGDEWVQVFEPHGHNKSSEPRLENNPLIGPRFEVCHTCGGTNGDGYDDIEHVPGCKAHNA